MARQQQFVRAFKSQVKESFAPIAMLKVVNTITKNVEVAQGGGSDVSGRTVLSYALFAYGLPRGRVFQSRIEGFEGDFELTTDSSNVTRAIRTFTHPDVESSEKATAVALGEKSKRRVRAPRDTTVTVLNGNGVAGSASTAGFQLGERGYQILTPPNGLPANAPRFDYFRTQVYYAGEGAGGSRSGREGDEPVLLGRDQAPSRGDLPARERRDAHGRRRPDLPRDSGGGRDRPDAAAREAERRLRSERLARPPPRAPLPCARSR